MLSYDPAAICGGGLSPTVALGISGVQILSQLKMNRRHKTCGTKKTSLKQGPRGWKRVVQQGPRRMGRRLERSLGGRENFADSETAKE